MIRKVLFVDDDQIMLLAIEKRFATYSDSFTMVMAHDGFEAVRKLKEHAVSLIVLDLKMPRMDGMSLLTYSREKYPDIPVIIVSGYRTAEMYKLAKAKGVIAYISKPFQVDDLGKIIMNTLQKEAAGGIMHNVSPTVFLQLMEMEAKTCTIRILGKNSDEGGILYFSEGKLLDVRVGEVSGIDAAYKVFSWEEVTLFIENKCVPRENVINSELQPIIMKAVGMKDEEEEHEEAIAEVAEEPDDDELLGSVDDEPWESDLDDLELPDALIHDEKEVVVQPESSIQDPPEQPPPQSKTPEQSNPLTKIQTLLNEKVGPKCGLESIYHDETMGNMVEYLSEIGALFEFGKLKVGYINNGKESDRIIIPGKPNIILKVNPRCPQDKIIKALTDYL